jgi:hypothetical protein
MTSPERGTEDLQVVIMGSEVPPCSGTSLKLNLDYVFCVRSLGTFCHGELDRFALFKAFEAGTLDRGVMHEDIGAGGTLNKAVALGIVKPLDFALFSFH